MPGLRNYLNSIPPQATFQIDLPYERYHYERHGARQHCNSSSKQQTTTEFPQDLSRDDQNYRNGRKQCRSNDQKGIHDKDMKETLLDIKRFGNIDQTAKIAYKSYHCEDEYDNVVQSESFHY